MNPYDGKQFQITTPNIARTAAGYLSPMDDSLPPARIAGSEFGSRYDLDPKNTGNMDDYIQGPWVGKEIDEFIAKRGGVVGRMNGGDVAPFPGWTVAQFLEPLRAPVVGGPNAGPLGGPKPIVLPPTAAPTPPAAPVTPPAAPPAPATVTLTQAQVDKHKSLLDQIRQFNLSSEVRLLLNKIESIIHHTRN